MACPLCTSPQSRPSWIGYLTYSGDRFPYSECLECGSSYGDPMPSDDTVRGMYGPDYTDLSASGGEIVDPKAPGRVVETLRGLTPGVFVDYGCGSGALLKAAAAVGWRSVGVEFDPRVATAVARDTGLEVVPVGAPVPTADVLHLGDVIEHLTRMDDQFPGILEWIRPGGRLIAQGPLDANTSLFTSLLKLARRLRRGGNTEMPPYHVILATAEGQVRLFDRFGLERLTYDVTEVDWPAPTRLLARDLGRPRALVLFAVRRLSRAITALGPVGWGNRYFYVGRKSAT